MFSSIFGVPTHPLVVHAVVVFVPLAALAGLAVALWPAARARYAPWALAIATVAGVSVPIATHTGELLRSQLGSTPLIRAHAELGDQLLPFVALLWLALAAFVGIDLLGRRRGVRPGWFKVVGVAASVVAVLAAVGSGVQVVRIGDSGAKAVWHGVATTSHGSANAGNH
jgi:hypothetical protein